MPAASNDVDVAQQPASCAAIGVVHGRPHRDEAIGAAGQGDDGRVAAALGGPEGVGRKTSANPSTIPAPVVAPIGSDQSSRLSKRWRNAAKAWRVTGLPGR